MNRQLCKEEVKSTDSLKSHYVEHHNSEIKTTLKQFSSSPRQCEACDLNFQHENDLLFHVGFLHDGISQLRMDKNLEKLNLNIEAEAENEEKHPIEDEIEEIYDEKCEYCGKHFDNKLSLLGCYTLHFKNELKNVCKSLLDSEQDQQCPFCSEKFEHFDSLTCHLGTVHLLVNDFLIQEGVRPLVPSNEDYDIYFDSQEI